jgi:predicted transcriptional regulator
MHSRIYFSMHDFFLQEKPARILLSITELRNPYPLAIAKKVDTTYAHAQNVLSKMESYGIIKSRRKGRTRYVKLTKRGEKIAKAIKNLYSTIERTKEARRAH